ncbi:MAG TPA: hypothetical protein VEO01_05545 [Pseudonocardiaceae bacterium]|nr:hypothetical protein [Pseudonocardiaceae bacterium]
MPHPVFSLMLVVFGLTTGEFVIAGILPDVATNLSAIASSNETAVSSVSHRLTW